jgi:glutaredoxin-like protein NrdH
VGFEETDNMEKTHVEGKDKGKVMLYTLSTCGWCKKTKALLKDLDVAYDYIDVDLLKGDAQDEVVKEIKKFNPACNFPTMVINDNKCIVGFNEDDIREALG